MTDQERFTRAVQNLIEKTGDKISLDLDMATMVVLIAQLQLSLRHPSNQGQSARAMRSLVLGLIATLEKIEPEIGPLLMLGFDPAHDVPARNLSNS